VNGMSIEHQLDLVLNHVDTPKQAKTMGKSIHRNEQRTIPKRVLGFLRRTSHHGTNSKVLAGQGALDCGNVNDQFKQVQDNGEHKRVPVAARPSTRSLQHTMKQHDLDLVIPAHTSRAVRQHGTNSKDWVGSILVVPHMVDSAPSQPPRRPLRPMVADETCRVSTAIVRQSQATLSDLSYWNSRSRPSTNVGRAAPAHRGEDIALSAPMRQPSMTDDSDIDSDKDAASFVDIGIASPITTRLCKQRKKKNLFDSSTSATTDQEQSLSPYTTESVDDEWHCDAISLNVDVEQHDHPPFDQADSIHTIEIAPGFLVPFRGVEETMVYIATDATTTATMGAKKSRYIASNTCWTCTTLVHHIADVAYVFCPVCRTLQPTNVTDTVDPRAAGTSETSGCWGVGLGFLTDDWKTWKADFLAS
jgi:hypothetical protein